MPKKKVAKKEQRPDDFSASLQNLPKDVQKKLLDIKSKVDKFKDNIRNKFGKYIMGVALLPAQQPAGGLPPSMQGGQQMSAPQGLPPTMRPQIQAPQMPPAQPGQKPAADQINVLVLIDDSDSKKMTKQELATKLTGIIQQMAKDQDERLSPQIILQSELWQNCYDAKYDLIQMIATAAPVFDTGMLAALKISELHKGMVVRKFERYIVSYVLAGSLVQGRATDKSDIDVFIVVDDTDVKRMTRAELKDKLRAIIIGMGLEAGDATGIRNKINIQVYILTDFWDSIKEANPIIFTFLRDGVPLYDRGTFMPWKHLLQMGRIKPSQEAIDLYMNTGDQVLNRAKLKMKEIGMEDTFWAILTPTQAALMLYGIAPPTPKETPEVLRNLLVKKEKLIEEEYVKILEHNIEVRKSLEHGDKKELTGKEIDLLLAQSDRYLKRLNRLFQQITKIKEEESILAVYENAVTMIRDVLKLEGRDRVGDAEIVRAFEDEMISTGKIPAKYLRVLNELLKAKKDFDAGKLTKAEIENVKKDASEFTRIVIDHIQRKRGKDVQRSRIKIKHGHKHGEVILLADEAFIIFDLDADEKKVSRATLTKAGGMTAPKSSSMVQLEKALAKMDASKKVYIKERIFEDLRNIFGSDIEVLVE